jgi:SAM-dependent methyltransferase
VTPIDRLLQRWRIDRARRYIPAGSRVLDVGCADGALFRRLGDNTSDSVGIDPALDTPVDGERFTLVPGHFPADLTAGGEFDVITMLAVLEHVPPDEQRRLAAACAERLRPGGRLIVTVPAPLVDRILDVLERLRVIDGMATEQHYGFDPSRTPAVFVGADFRLFASERFELGLNHLYVFERERVRVGSRGSG